MTSIGGASGSRSRSSACCPSSASIVSWPIPRSRRRQQLAVERGVVDDEDPARQGDPVAGGWGHAGPPASGGSSLRDRRLELLGADRLADVVVHPGGEARLAVAGHGVGGEPDDPEPAIRPPGTDPTGRLEAVHLGHLDVHQHDVVAARLDGVDRGLAVADDVGLRTPSARAGGAPASGSRRCPPRGGSAGPRRRPLASPGSRSAGSRTRPATASSATGFAFAVVPASASASASWRADGFTGLTSIAVMFGAVRACWPIDDRMTTGIGCSGRSAASASASSTPSRSGISRSRTAASNSLPAADPLDRLAAATPSPAPSTPQRSRKLVMIRRFVALSSTTRIRQPRMLRSGAGGGASGSDVGRGREAQAERAALAGDAGARRGQRAAHRLGEAAADRQAEARPAVAPRDRRVDLAERLEELVHPVRGDADAGVADLDRRSSTAPGAARLGASPSTDRTTSPCSVNLIAFDRRLRTIWRSRPASPTIASGQAVAHRVDELDALAATAIGAMTSRALSTRRAERERLRRRGRPCPPRSSRSRGCR